MNWDGTSPSFLEEHLSPADHWILHRLQVTINETLSSLEAFHFHQAAQGLYQFVWNDLCDWYLEAVKPSFAERAHPQAQAAASHTIHMVFSQTLKLLHPFLPFITEELWSHLFANQPPLIIASFPAVHRPPFMEEAKAFETFVKRPVEAIRNIRGENHLPPGKWIPAAFASLPESPSSEHVALVQSLGKVREWRSFQKGHEPPEAMKSAVKVLEDQTVFIPRGSLMDKEAEKARLTKEIRATEEAIAAMAQKLSNPAFLSGAPDHIVARERKKIDSEKEKLKTLNEALAKVISMS